MTYFLLFRYTDNEVDLDSINKLRAYRIRNFALWLAEQTKVSSLKVKYVYCSNFIPLEQCVLRLYFVFSKDKDGVKFSPAITGGLNSNEMIIQQLEELLKSDCKISQNEIDLKKNVSASRILGHGTMNKAVASNLQPDSMLMTAPSVIFSNPGTC